MRTLTGNVASRRPLRPISSRACDEQRVIVIGLAALLLCACAAAPPPPAPAPPPPPPPPTADQQFEALAQRYLREFPRAVAGRRHRARRSPLRRSARRRQRRRLAGALAFAELYLAALAPIDRAQAVARQPGGRAAAARTSSSTERWKMQTLEDWRWNPLIYTRIAGDALYNLLARDFAPAPERLRNIGKRLDEMPRFLAQVREVLEPARVPKVHAETAVKQNAGLMSLLDGEIASRSPRCRPQTRRPCAPAWRARAARSSQHQIWLEKRLAARSARATFVWARSSTTRSSRSRCSRRCRARRSARAPKPSSRRRAPRCTTIARQVLKGRRGAAADCRTSPAPRSSSAPSGPRSSSPTRSGPARDARARRGARRAGRHHAASCARRTS